MFLWVECSSDPPLLVPGTIQLPGSCWAVCPQLSQGKCHDYCVHPVYMSIDHVTMKSDLAIWQLITVVCLALIADLL